VKVRDLIAENGKLGWRPGEYLPQERKFDGLLKVVQAQFHQLRVRVGPHWDAVQLEGQDLSFWSAGMGRE